MAATPTIVKSFNVGNSDVIDFGTVSVGTYATSGVAVDTTGDIEWEAGNVGTAGGYTAEYVASTKKIKVYRQKDPANAGGADIPGPEVANGVDLSAINFPFIACRPK